jgi:hypothetical protein
MCIEMQADSELRSKGTHGETFHVAYKLEHDQAARRPCSSRVRMQMQPQYYPLDHRHPKPQMHNFHSLHYQQHIRSMHVHLQKGSMYILFIIKEIFLPYTNTQACI